MGVLLQPWSTATSQTTKNTIARTPIAFMSMGNLRMRGWHVGFREERTPVTSGRDFRQARAPALHKKGGVTADAAGLNPPYTVVDFVVR